jgi:hypothetical protein
MKNNNNTDKNSVMLMSWRIEIASYKKQEKKIVQFANTYSNVHTFQLMKSKKTIFLLLFLLTIFSCCSAVLSNGRPYTDEEKKERNDSKQNF